MVVVLTAAHTSSSFSLRQRAAPALQPTRLIDQQGRIGSHQARTVGLGEHRPQGSDGALPACSTVAAGSALPGPSGGLLCDRGDVVGGDLVQWKITDHLLGEPPVRVVGPPGPRRVKLPYGWQVFGQGRHCWAVRRAGPGSGEEIGDGQAEGLEARRARPWRGRWLRSRCLQESVEDGRRPQDDPAEVKSGAHHREIEETQLLADPGWHEDAAPVVSHQRRSPGTPSTAGDLPSVAAQPSRRTRAKSGCLR